MLHSTCTPLRRWGSGCHHHHGAWSNMHHGAPLLLFTPFMFYLTPALAPSSRNIATPEVAAAQGSQKIFFYEVFSARARHALKASTRRSVQTNCVSFRSQKDSKICKKKWKILKYHSRLHPPQAQRRENETKRSWLMYIFVPLQSPKVSARTLPQGSNHEILTL